MEAAYASTADVQQDEFARKPCERKGRTDGRDLEGEIKGVFIKCESGHSSPGSPTPGQPDSTWPAARGLPSAFSSWPPSLLIPPFLSPPSLCISFVSFALLVHRFFFSVRLLRTCHQRSPSSPLASSFPFSLYSILLQKSAVFTLSF